MAFPKRRGRRRLGAFGVLVAGLALAGAPQALAGTQKTQHIGVIPGNGSAISGSTCGARTFQPPNYLQSGPTVPALSMAWFDVGAPNNGCSTGYTWTGIGHYATGGTSITGVTTTALDAVDTVILYGVQWASLDSSSQAAINAFATRGKVIIWDADSTVAKPASGQPPAGQDYSSYLIPFKTLASGGQKAASKTPVTATTGDILDQPIAISDQGLPFQPHAIGDMSVLQPTNPAQWHTSIGAINETLADALGNHPAPVVAWAEANPANHVGMTIYSGIDADALDMLGPDGKNWALAEFENQLGASFCNFVCTAGPTPPPPHHNIILIRAGDGTGTVSTSPAPISGCGTLCFPDTTVVTLVATPAPDSVFAGWSGACSGPQPTCTVTVNADVPLTATFSHPAALPHVISVTRAGDGDGTVTSNPAGIDCGPVCAGNFLSGSAVTLTATPANGSVFVGWSGACTGNGACSVSADADRAVTALFAHAAPTCTITPRTAWVHKIVVLHGTTTFSAATNAVVLSTAGKQLGAASQVSTAFSVSVDTRKLPTNKSSTIHVELAANGVVGCTATTTLRVDNTLPRALKITHHRSGRFLLVSFKPTEPVLVKAYGKGKKPTVARLKTTKRTTIGVRPGVKRVRLVLSDRAGNVRTIFVKVA